MMEYKFDHLIHDQNLTDILHSDLRPWPVVILDPSDALIRISSALASAIDAPDLEPILVRVFAALSDLAVPCDSDLDALDFFFFIATALESSRTPIVHLALKCLLALYRTSPDRVREFVGDCHPAITRLVRSPDLMQPVITLVLLSLDSRPGLATELVHGHTFARQLLDLSANAFEPRLTATILQTLAALLDRADIEAFDAAQLCELRGGLRALTRRYLTDADDLLRIPEIQIPALNILTAMFVKWDVADEVAIDTYGVLAQMALFTDRAGDTSVYCAALRFWNDLFVHYPDEFGGSPWALQVMNLLLAHYRVGAPRLPIFFVLSNIIAMPGEAERFLANEGVLDRMFTEFGDLGHSEKENFVILVSSLIVARPREAMVAFAGVAEFVEAAFDCVQSARVRNCALLFLHAVDVMIGVDNRARAMLGTEAAADALVDMAECAWDELAIVAGRLLAEAGL
jgi:hypothetical protein